MFMGEGQGQGFWHDLRRHRGRPALICPREGEVSYEDLAARADLWAARYREAVPDLPRLLIALRIAPRIEAIAAYLGALRGGHAVMLCEAGAGGPDERILSAYRPNLTVEGQGAEMALGVPDREPAAMHPDLRVLLSTSGTTGAPKLVRLSDGNIAANARAIGQYLGLGPDERAITTLPLHYSYGMSVLNAHLAAGASLVLTEASIVDPAFWALFRDRRATSLALVPHQFDLLDSIGFEAMDLPSLRTITQAGGRLPPPQVERFTGIGRAAGWRLFVMYGQTEAAPRIAYVPPDALPAHAGTIGQAIPGGRLWLADAHGAEITAPGTPGELVYEGPNVMLGYAESRDELAAPAGPQRLKTGDIAERTEAGFFRIAGRKSRFVKLYGLRLSLDEMEAGLGEAGYPAFCFNVDDALVVLHRDADAGAAIAAHLAWAYDLPGGVIATEHLAETPLLITGKVDFRALQSMAEEVKGRQAAAPRSEADLVDVMGRATRTAQVGPQDTFASLGGDSLAYLQVTMALEERLGRVPEGWERMTLAQLEAVPQAPSRWSRLGADVLVRILAVSLIVTTHLTWWPTNGGAWVLLGVIGYSLARFGRSAIEAGRPGKLVFQMLYPILPLYFFIMASLMGYGLRFSPEMLTLTANLVPVRWGDLVTPNWFVSLYVQLTLFCVGLLAVPRVRRAVALDAWRSGMVALGAALVVSMVYLTGFAPALDSAEPVHAWAPPFRLPGLPDPGTITDYRLWQPVFRVPMTTLPMVALGWCIFCADTRRRRWITAAAILATVWVFPAPGIGYSVTMLAHFGLLLWGVSVPVPKRLAGLLRAAAGATLFVYLLHGVPVYLLRYKTGLYDAMGPVLSLAVVLAASFAAAWLAKAAFDLADRAALTAFRRLGAHKGATVA